MGNFIIDTRIKKLERIKQNLLTLKKNQRGDELTQVNGMINRLKKWNLELDKNVPVKTKPSGNYKNESFIKDCHQDENTDTFCALMRKIKEKKQ